MAAVLRAKTMWDPIITKKYANILVHQCIEYMNLYVGVH